MTFLADTNRSSCARLSILVLACALVISPLARAEAGEQSPPSLAEAMKLRDVHGQLHTWDELREARLVVLVFLGTECPLATLYLPRLEELHQRYRAQGVVVWGVDANYQDTLEEIAHLVRTHEITFPIYKDPEQAVAHALGATRTPEATVLDPQGQVRYRGRIDDQYGVDYQRPRAQRADLAQALDELLRGEPVLVAETPLVGCLIGRKPKQQESDVTWSSHIAAIFQEHCQECHRPGQLAPLTLLDYDDVIGWGPTIDEVVASHRMPPWHADPSVGSFSNENRLSDEQIDLIHRWVEAGSPEGDPQQTPPAREFAPPGWRAITPDQILYMRDTPFEVPAEGVLDYQHFTVDPGFTEDKWISGVECRPGNPQVVHHMDVFLLWPGEEKPDELRDLFGGYAPGAQPWIWPKGTAKFVPAGAKFVFQLHYTPNGKRQLDRSLMGIEFADAADVERPVQNGTAINFEFVIPPRTSDHPIEASYRVAEDASLLTLTPHMHWRGKTFLFEAFFPDGRRQPLLYVPNYDFRWQTTYRLTEPISLPAGTEVRCTAHFDNSEENLDNPDPHVPVRFGFNTFDEMMIGYFEMAGKDMTARRSPIVHHFAVAEGRSWRRWAVAGAVVAAAVGAVWSTVRAVKKAQGTLPARGTRRTTARSSRADV